MLWLLLVVVRFVALDVVSDMGPPTSMGDSHFGGDRGGLLEECCDILQKINNNIYFQNNTN